MCDSQKFYGSLTVKLNDVYIDKLHLVICGFSLTGFESNMVTLILSIGRSHSIRHLSIGRNFAMKSR